MLKYIYIYILAILVLTDWVLVVVLSQLQNGNFTHTASALSSRQ